MKNQFSFLFSKSEFTSSDDFSSLFESRAKVQMEICKKNLEVKYKVGSKGNKKSSSENNVQQLRQN